MNILNSNLISKKNAKKTLKKRAVEVKLYGGQGKKIRNLFRNFR